jgi:UDP-N-acetyl-2-amino-2-deoxyglucuronate dehydrogenase
VHIGLIGAGNISGTHARAIGEIPGATVSAVVAPTHDRAKTLAAQHGAAAYHSLDAFLNHRPMEMVVIGSPSGLHGEHGAAAARRGLHVLVEKPIEITTARVDALIAAARQAGVTLGVIFQDRVKPDIARWKEVVDAGALGTPILASARVKWYRPPEYYGGSRWRGTWALDGGGALMNQGVHTVDLLTWLAGPVRRVYARAAAKLHAIEVEDTAVALLEFASGAFGTLEATTSAYPGYARRLELTGSKGTAILDGDHLDLGGVRHQLGASPTPVRPQSDTSQTPPVNASSPVVADVTAHRRVFEDFIQAVSEGRPPLCDGAAARASVAVIEAIYRSSSSQAPVEIDYRP